MGCRTHRSRRVSKWRHNTQEADAILPPVSAYSANRTATEFHKEDDLLVLYLAGILHSILPLHAIPLPDQARPLIARNSILYRSSIAMMTRNTLRTRPKCLDGHFRAAGFARLGPEDPVEEERMRSTVENALCHLRGLDAHSRRDLTKYTFIGAARDVNLLHYHGHASLEPSDVKN